MQLRLENVTKRFGEKTVLGGVDGVFRQGRIYGLLGRNGAGKTTLFNCLSGEMTMDEGRVLLDHGGESRPLAEEDVGYVYSSPILPEFLTGYEFIKFYMDINRDELPDGEQIDEWFDRMRFTREDRHRLIKHYSHGMKNKIQMMLFFISKPPVILLDEPLTSFDVVVALEMKQLLREMKEDHILIFSTHILQLASDLCDELTILHNGHLSPVSADLPNSPEFEQRLIEMLKDDPHVADE